MRKVLIVFALVAPLTALPGLASAKGCLKGAAVGGAAGHVAGHHGLIGAAAGCAVEHHREKVRDKKKADYPAPDSAAPKAGSAIAPEGTTGK